VRNERSKWEKRTQEVKMLSEEDWGKRGKLHEPPPSPRGEEWEKQYALELEAEKEKERKRLCEFWVNISSKSSEEKASKPCECDMDLLMTDGCQCEGV
jgi:hypothetical protein